MSFSKKFRKSSKGFSLLELMVVLAIFFIMTTVLIADIPSFREKSSLDLTVSEVATYVRGAQVYGAAQVGSTGDEAEPVTYGVEFNKDTSEFYLVKNSDKRKETYTLNNFKIADIIFSENGGPLVCDINKLIVNYQSNTYTENIGTALEAQAIVNNGDSESFDYLDIKIQSTRGNGLSGACVRIYGNGQIANTSCSDCSR